MVPSEILEAFLKHRSVDAGELELLGFMQVARGAHAAILGRGSPTRKVSMSITSLLNVASPEEHIMTRRKPQPIAP